MRIKSVNGDDSNTTNILPGGDVIKFGKSDKKRTSG